MKLGKVFASHNKSMLNVIEIIATHYYYAIWAPSIFGCNKLLSLKLVRAACVRCHGTKCPLKSLKNWPLIRSPFALIRSPLAPLYRFSNLLLLYGVHPTFYFCTVCTVSATSSGIFKNVQNPTITPSGRKVTAGEGDLMSAKGDLMSAKGDLMSGQFFNDFSGNLVP